VRWEVDVLKQIGSPWVDRSSDADGNNDDHRGDIGTRDGDRGSDIRRGGRFTASRSWPAAHARTPGHGRPGE
jgi:hypothetical protein